MFETYSKILFITTMGLLFSMFSLKLLYTLEQEANACWMLSMKTDCQLLDPTRWEISFDQTSLNMDLCIFLYLSILMKAALKICTLQILNLAESFFSLKIGIFPKRKSDLLNVIKSEMLYWIGSNSTIKTLQLSRHLPVLSRQ